MNIKTNKKAGIDGLNFLIEATKPEVKDPYWAAQEEIKEMLE